MRALILRNDADAAVANSRALIDKGFQILCVDTREVAEALVKMDVIDLLVMDERVGGQLTHTIALSAERNNPYTSAILMTDRSGAETDDLYELIPSLYALAGRETAPSLIGQLAVASVVNSQEVQARITQNAILDMVDDAISDVIDDVVLDMADDLVPDAPIIEEVDTPAVATITPEPITLDDDIDIPSYADVIFATPALAELSHTAFYPFDEDQEDTSLASDLPDLATIFAQKPLLLNKPVANTVPA